MRIFWKIPILALPNLRPLKNFVLTKKCKKKMVNFKTNYGVHKVEKAWQYFPLSDWLVKIMTSWERRRRHENFEDAEFELTQSVADESSRRRSAQSTRTKSLFTKLAMSVHSSALLCATGAWGGKPIGRVRVNNQIWKKTICKFWLAEKSKVL